MPNVKRLCAGGDLEQESFKLAQKPIRITDVEFSNSTPLAQNRCYKLVWYYSTELNLKDKAFFFSFLCGGKIILENLKI